MIDTSADYKTQIQAHTTRWTPRVTIDYSDYNIDNSIEPIVSKPDRTSDNSQIADGVESPTYKWFQWGDRFEWNVHLRSTEATENEKGALSQQMSDVNRNFGTYSGVAAGFAAAGFAGASPLVLPPSFTVTFSPRTVTSVKAVFDDVWQEYAEDFDITIYIGTTADTIINITGNTSFRFEQTLGTAVLLATSVEVKVTKWSHANVKAKVIETFTSLQQAYAANEIISISVNEESEAEKATNPIGNVTSNTCDITLLNINSEFDNDNEASVLAGNVIKNRRIKPYLQLNDLTDDEMALSEYYATQWNVNNEDMTAQVSGQDIIGLMDEQEYTKSQFISPGTPQNFTYTTTADFNGFTKDNTASSNNQLVFGGQALLCSDSGFSVNPSGYTPVDELTPVSGATYCGTADKQISYTYTPGTSITLSLSVTETIPVGANVLYYVSFTTEEDYQLIENGVFNYTPENISDTTQVIDFRVFMVTQATQLAPVIDDISITLTEQVTLGSLAAKVIQDYDDETGLIEGRYIIDQSYGDIEIPAAYLSPQSYKSALRVITEAAGGRGYQRRDGYIILEALPTLSTTARSFTDTNTYQRSNLVNPENLFNRVTVPVNKLTLAASASEVANVDIEIADTEVQDITVFFETDPTEDTSITYSGLPASVTITDSTIYTWGADLEITNASGSDQTFTLTINGKAYTVKGGQKYQANDTESQRKTGIIELIIDNPLIQTIEQAMAIGDLLISSYSSQRRDIMIDVTPDPSLEVGDTIEGKPGAFFVTSGSELKLNTGQLTHTLRGKK